MSIECRCGHLFETHLDHCLAKGCECRTSIEWLWFNALREREVPLTTKNGRSES